ncbi:MmcQ/YjbR family DNA-binding protein [Erwinia pyrifoliae]|uniref:Uncharacterized protein n=1 Tax=Erwinia pyrifoliae TaxID=79967 RepID=A0ABY5X8E5_ERWPY|nr:hypothetical protein [Erwinia pyrifoliae]UWS33308.1 hypothetical protein NYP84_17290 [Erwinia pyrifoliae]
MERDSVQGKEVPFAMFYEEGGRPVADLKSSPALADRIRDQHSDVQASTLLDPPHRNTVLPDGSLKDSQIYCLVDASLQQVLREANAAVKTKAGSHFTGPPCCASSFLTGALRGQRRRYKAVRRAL